MKTTTRPDRIRTWRRAALLALLLTVAAAWIVFDSLFAPFSKDAVTVVLPNFCGTLLDDVVPADWMELRTEYRHDASAPAGTVLSQTPVAGSRRKLTDETPLCKVTLSVSLGKETVTLPNLVGKDERAATAALRELGLSVMTVRRVGALPEGSVISMEPHAGTTVPTDSTVTLTVCEGTPTSTVTVPNLIGRSRSDALVELWMAQLGVAQIVEEDSDLPDGTVIRQSHLPGTTVIASTRLTLYVSRQRFE